MKGSCAYATVDIVDFTSGNPVLRLLLLLRLRA
jgi:hypothetical protein